jgi:hypothetical protein
MLQISSTFLIGKQERPECLFERFLMQKLLFLMKEGTRLRQDERERNHFSY